MTQILRYVQQCVDKVIHSSRLKPRALFYFNLRQALKVPIYLTRRHGALICSKLWWNGALYMVYPDALLRCQQNSMWCTDTGTPCEAKDRPIQGMRLHYLKACLARCHRPSGGLVREDRAPTPWTFDPLTRIPHLVGVRSWPPTKHGVNLALRSMVWRWKVTSWHKTSATGLPIFKAV